MSLSRLEAVSLVAFATFMVVPLAGGFVAGATGSTLFAGYNTAVGFGVLVTSIVLALSALRRGANAVSDRLGGGDARAE